MKENVTEFFFDRPLVRNRCMLCTEFYWVLPLVESRRRSSVASGDVETERKKKGGREYLPGFTGFLRKSAPISIPFLFLFFFFFLDRMT